MGQVFSKLQSVRSRVALKVAQVFGFTVGFNHRNTGQVTLYARFVETGSELDTNSNAVTEIRYILLQLPVQTNFLDEGSTEAAGITVGDAVIHRGREYNVVEFKRDDKDRTYHIKAVESKALSLGATE